MYLPDLDRLLSTTSEYTDEDGTKYAIERYELGDLVLPTGRVVAGEPMMLTEGMVPFEVPLEPGRYPVVAWVAALSDAGVVSQRRVAALQLVARDEPAARWKPALTTGQELAELEDDDAYFGYPVDGGRGGLADLTTAQALAQWDFDDLLTGLEAPEEDDEIGAVLTTVDKETGANIVAVHSGWGDGHYPTFAGYSATGELTALVTDFLVVPEEKTEEKTITSEAS